MENFELNGHSPETTEEDIKNLFNQFNPRDQSDRVVLLMNIPSDRRPSNLLTIAEREEEIISWAKDNNSLEQLAKTIKGIIEKQYK
ncbi:MAG: hypothetical protein COV33_00720 [Candidatus Zambryskibacteria bacterium CG10_big_fil_rev_8_21_14_0_10_34_34]|uniref:Uncharacterized protein n=1 Tax=Candidatus Zambryskibacteria bacterium CG10_big_fil_rev_8_21_14_0_10_34_34 TaxID=1975114 RepID=A0A2H0R182_9BACT|nr:MAG: hypothetical protein COV33_00720 [Candidatus Zambryskibacteria bacterium CG10_big_fil_rev_8_21_14_0_10_34_34]